MRARLTFGLGIIRLIAREPRMASVLVKLAVRRVHLALMCWRHGVTAEEVRRLGRLEKLTGRPSKWPR
jgi:hypothetical protein